MDDLRFNLTSNMTNITIRILEIKNLLKRENIEGKERKELEKEKEQLKKQFIKEFQKNNKEEITRYNELKDIID